MLTERPLDAELKGIITMRYLETLVKTCTARVLGLPGIQRRGEDSSGEDGWKGGGGGQRSKGVGVGGGGDRT